MNCDCYIPRRDDCVALAFPNGCYFREMERKRGRLIALKESRERDIAENRTDRLPYLSHTIGWLERELDGYQHPIIELHDKTIQSLKDWIGR